jgi:Secretion system C-terminal sorting domain
MKKLLSLILLLASTTCFATPVAWNVYLNYWDDTLMPDTYTFSVMQQGVAVFSQQIPATQSTTVQFTLEEGCYNVVLSADSPFPADFTPYIEQDNLPNDVMILYYPLVADQITGQGTNTMTLDLCTDSYCQAQFNTAILDQVSNVQFSDHSEIPQGFIWSNPSYSWVLDGQTSSTNASLYTSFTDNQLHDVCHIVSVSSSDGLATCVDTNCVTVDPTQMTCYPSNQFLLQVQVNNGSGSELGYLAYGILDSSGTAVASNGMSIFGTSSTYVLEHCLEQGCYQLNMDNSIGANTQLTLTTAGQNVNVSTFNETQTGVVYHIEFCIEGPNAVESISKENSIVLYPNPASDQFTVSSLDGSLINDIQIIDQTGRMVLRSQGLSVQKETVDVSNFGSGIYTVLMNGAFSQRVVVTK